MGLRSFDLVLEPI